MSDMTPEPPTPEDEGLGAPTSTGNEDLQEDMFSGFLSFQSFEERTRNDTYFDRGWMAPAGAVTPEERQEAREKYWDSTGIPPSMFDWEKWREKKGYKKRGQDETQEEQPQRDQDIQDIESENKSG
jgi:hypothetical protein